MCIYLKIKMNISRKCLQSLLTKFLLITIVLPSIICNYGLPKKRQFSSVLYLEDGVRQVNVFFEGIRGRETATGHHGGSSRGIVVRELTNGKQLLSLIYSGIPNDLKERDDEAVETASQIFMEKESDSNKSEIKLRECVLHKDSAEAQRFIETFDSTAVSHTYANMAGSPIDSNVQRVSYVSLEGKNKTDVPAYLRSIVAFGELKNECFKLHRRMRKKLKLAKRQRHFEKEHNHTSTRRERRAVSDLLSIPTTKWCGRSNRADSYGQLGALDSADNCCRQHDSHCPFFIQSFERKYGYFNLGLSTLSHCSCDLRFRTCLKQSRTGASEVVGRVFFDVVQSKCFDFERRKICLKRGLWSCRKWGYESQAVVREPLPWETSPKDWKSKKQN